MPEWRSQQQYRVEISGDARIWPMIPDVSREYEVGLRNAETRLRADLDRVLEALRGARYYDTPEAALNDAHVKIATCLAAEDLLAACKHVAAWFARLQDEQVRKTHRSFAEAVENWPTLGDDTGPLDLQPLFDAIAKAEVAGPRPPQ